jgi:hypothetical protein
MDNFIEIYSEILHVSFSTQSSLRPQTGALRKQCLNFFSRKT